LPIDVRGLGLIRVQIREGQRELNMPALVTEHLVDVEQRPASAGTQVQDSRLFRANKSALDQSRQLLFGSQEAMQRHDVAGHAIPQEAGEPSEVLELEEVDPFHTGAAS
jgi:glucose-6-phosphate isomerase